MGFFDILDHTQFPKGLFQLAALGGALWPVRAAHRNSLHESRPEWRRDAFAGSGRDRRCAGRIGLGIEMVVAEMAAAYEVARWSGMTSAGSTTALDIYAGGRAWWQRANIQIAATGTLNIFDLSVSRSGVLSAEKSVSWFDPLVGLRLRFVVSGDVGGFDVGSKFSWQAWEPWTTKFADRDMSPGAEWSATKPFRPTTRKAAGSAVTNTTLQCTDPSSALPRGFSRGHASCIPAPVSSAQSMSAQCGRDLHP